MDRDKWFLILTGLVCGCCVLLCVVVTYLCVVVRRLRRKLNDLSRARDGNIVLENESKRNTGVDVRMRIPSNNSRYTEDPMKRPRKHQSSLYSDPDEPVTVLRLEREVQQESPNKVNTQVLEPSTSTQNIMERSRTTEEHTMLIEFVNLGFNPDTKRDSTSESNDAQPIYTNEEELAEQPIYQNNNEMDGEPVYQNTGELSYINNPELLRCKTMDISQIS